MATAPSTTKQPVIELGGVCAVPSWVGRWVGSSISITERMEHDCECRVVRGKNFSLVTVRVVGARHDDALKMQRRTSKAYKTVAREIATSSTPHPLRFWNFIPDIRCEMGGGLNRYMSFNAGRFSAFFECYADRNGFTGFADSIATATGIGYHGDDLVIHGLASACPGVHIHNPKQRPSYKYSASFGPLPPCFARATVLPPAGSSPMLILIGGTASVCGETSTHLDDVRAQTEETFDNIEHLIRSVPLENNHTGSQPDKIYKASLRWLDTLRVYYLHPEDREMIERIVYTRAPHVENIEYLRADICRRELLVEIEGTARPRAHTGHTMSVIPTTETTATP